MGQYERHDHKKRETYQTYQVPQERKNIQQNSKPTPRAYRNGDIVAVAWPMTTEQEQKLNAMNHKNGRDVVGKAPRGNHPCLVLNTLTDPETNKKYIVVAYGTSKKPTTHEKYYFALNKDKTEHYGLRTETQYFDPRQTAILPLTKEWFPYCEKQYRITSLEPQDMTKFNTKLRNVLNDKVMQALRPKDTPENLR